MWIKLGLLSAAVLGCTAAAPDGAEVVATLHRLTGDWKAETARGSVIRVSFRTVAAGTAIVESFRTASGAETLTVYHRDGPTLNATHYCAQGNQPRLRLDPSSTKEVLQFTFYDGTNLGYSKGSHLVRLELRLKDSSHLERTEIYTDGDHREASVLHFVRVSSETRP